MKTCTMATSFVAEVLTSTGKLEKEEILTKLGRLTRQVSEMKLQVYELIENKYQDFLPDLLNAENLSDRVQSLSSEMQTVDDTIEKEIKTQLNMSTGQFQTLSSQFNETNATLVIAEKLCKLNDLMDVVAKSTRAEEFSTAASSLLDINSLLSHQVVDGEGEIKLLQNLHTEYRVLQQKFIFDLGEFWMQHIIWKTNDSKSAESSIDFTIVYSGEGKTSLVEAIISLEKMGALDTKLKQLSSDFVSKLIRPLLSNKTAKLEFSEKQSEKKVSVIIKSDDKANIPAPMDAFVKLEKLFAFLFKHLLSISPVKENNDLKLETTLMERFGLISAEDAVDMIVKECLVNAIPSNKAELENFRDVVSQTEKFNEKLLAIRFLSKSNKGLLDFVGNVNVLFANKKCQEILECARNLMTSEIHNTVIISPVKPVGELPPLNLEGPVFKKQKVAEKLAIDSQLSVDSLKLPVCHISTSIQSMMMLAYQRLQEATDSSEQCAIQLFYSVRNIFELFCSSFSRYHKQSLSTLPQLAAIHHNNCFFIAHHLMTLGHQFSRKLPSPLKDGSGTFVDMVGRIRKIGNDCFLEQMSSQKAQLLEYLQGAQGFSSVSEEENYLSCEKSIKQVLHQLRHLQRVWQEVLPPNIYSKAIGTLVNSVLSEMISCIVGLEDISQDDAKQLHTLLSEFGTNLAPLFKVVDDESVNTEIQLQKKVLKWRKYKELILLLQAGLQDIADRWADNKGPLAVEFSSNEVKPLIRALFQNTDRRAAILAKIH